MGIYRAESDSIATIQTKYSEKAAVSPIRRPVQRETESIFCTQMLDTEGENHTPSRVTRMSSETKVEKLEGVAIVGAGLAGCLLAVYLRRRGIPVDVFDSRPDMRKSLGLAGRSINLVLTSRGLDALSRVDLLVPILKLCTPVYGRTLHMQSGEQAYQAYGPDDSFCNYSISRAELNVELIKAADAAGGKSLSCGAACAS